MTRLSPPCPWTSWILLGVLGLLLCQRAVATAQPAAQKGTQPPGQPQTQTPMQIQSLVQSQTVALPAPDGGRLPSPTAPAERITFADAVRRAVARNPSVRVALAEIRRAEGLLKEARSASLPTLTGTLTYTRLNANHVLADGTIYQPQDSVLTGPVLAAPLFLPQGWVRWAQAGDNVDVARISAEDARRQVAITTARAYLTLVSQHRVIEVTELAAKNAHDHLDYSHQRFIGGVGTKLDEVRAAQELATDQSQVQTAYTALARAREALGVLIAADHPVDIADDAPLARPPGLDEAMREAPSRPDVRASARRERAARRVYRQSWADYLPYLTGNFEPYYEHSNAVALPSFGWQAMLVLNVPFYDGGYRYGAAREREALASEAKDNLEAVLRQARSDVRAAFESLYRSDEAMQRARDAARLADEALKLANLSYRAGASTNIEVIDAERVARDAEIAATEAEDASRQSRLDLLIASGRFP